MKKCTLGLLVLILSTSAMAAPEPRPNIIFMIGDGMGVAYTGAYRLYQDDLATPELETTVFDEMLVGMASTYPDDHNLVTDSAAAATALAAGVKTFNGAIGVNAQHAIIPSMLDIAKELAIELRTQALELVNYLTGASHFLFSDRELIH